MNKRNIIYKNTVLTKILFSAAAPKCMQCMKSRKIIFRIFRRKVLSIVNTARFGDKKI